MPHGNPPTPAEPETVGTDEAVSEPRAEEPAAAPTEDGAGDGPPPPDGDPVVALERERDEYLALAQRAQADFANFRKRAAKEAAVAGERAKSGLVGELLPVVDNLERALASAGGEAGDLASGVHLVHSELIAVLARNGIEQFDPRGERFDPTFHEALSTREGEDGGPGVVVEVVEKGYRLNDTVLRPARVVVSA